jgi:PAS domain S-box-containing protein
VVATARRAARLACAAPWADNPAMGAVGVWGEESDLREYAERMAEAERIAHFGVFRWEIATDRVRWSDELHRIYGLAPGEFVGTAEGFLSFLHPDDRDRIWSNIERSIATGESFVFEERIIRKDGAQRVLLSRGSPVMGADGEVAAIVGVCHDVTERVQAERALGLSERRMRAILDYSPSIVAVKDLDGRYLMSNAETGRVLGIDADEIIGRHCSELFPSIAERLRAADRLAAAEMEPVYDEAVLVRDGELRDYVTVTFALPDDAGRPIETCTIGTDVTERKEREAERRARTDWEQRIARTLAEDRMLVYSQPVIDLCEGGAHSFCELLVRKQMPSGEVLAPAAFLPAAERYGLIQSIDVWVVARALELASDVTPAVNLSAVTLCDAHARAEIVAQLGQAPAAARRLIFEITETADPSHLDAACEFAAELTTLGCGLALDDFGVGFGSFTYLRKLPLRYLKIDRSFIRDVVRSRDDRRVVESIIGIGHQFDLRLVAEGIEDAETLEFVRRLGVDFGQGFHLGRPAAVGLS